MMNSLFAGVSGLKGFETKMDVIGNNIANVNTSGFKTGRVTFSELLSQNIRRDGVQYSSAPRVQNQVGLGMRVSSIDRNFEQGALEATNVTTDLAIQGNSFFMVRNGDNRVLTRAGGFKFNATGALVNATGLAVQGFNADTNGRIIQGAATQDVKVNFTDVFRPQQTSTIRVAGNLNSNTSTREVVSQSSAFTVGGSLATLTTDLKNLDQVLISGDLVNGDQITITGEDSDGNAVNGTFTYGVGNDGTTVQSFVTFLQNQYGQNTKVGLEDGLIVLRNVNYGESNVRLDISPTITRVNQPTEVSTTGASNTISRTTAWVENGTPATAATLINDLDQVTNAFADGDTMIVDYVDDAGAAQQLTFTFGAGNDGTTLGDLRDFINANVVGTTGAATINASGQIEFTATVNQANQPGLRLISPSGNQFQTSSIGLDAPVYQATLEGSTGSKIISSTVYDSQGEPHTLVIELEQGDFNTWNYSTRFLNGEQILSGGTGSLLFDADGNFVTIQDALGNTVETIDVGFAPGNGAGNMNFSIDLKGSPSTGRLTQFDGLTTVKVNDQNGYGKGELLDVFIDSDGVVVGAYSNGRTKNLAQIALANVNNTQGLEHIGDGLFEVTTQAGNLIVDTAGNLAGVTVNSGFLEGSNVDLAEQFTEMIITQRAYQSNARVITTADQLLAEAVQLKR